jgi:hypothetical protein
MAGKDLNLPILKSFEKIKKLLGYTAKNLLFQYENSKFSAGLS